MVTLEPGHEMPSPNFEEASELFLQCLRLTVLLPQAPFPHLQCP